MIGRDGEWWGVGGSGGGAGLDFIFSDESFFAAFCAWFLFKSAVSSLLLNRVLFLVNSGPSPCGTRGNRSDRLQSLQSNTWEIID